MIVVSNTSPLNYLVLVDATHVLPDLYGRVAIPDAVLEELRKEGAPARVQHWAASLPAWLEVHATPENLPGELHRGEGAAIALAAELRAKLLLLDDLDARRYAKSKGFQVTGVLGVIRDAALSLPLFDWESKLINLQRNTNYRASPTLFGNMAAEIREQLARR